MDIESERRRLKKISEIHSYSEGFNGRLNKYRAIKINELCDRRGTLLDLGAGEGVLTKCIADGFEGIEITEASSVYLKKAKKMLSGYPVTFLNKLIEEFDTKNTFNLILASGILEHVEDPQKILKKVKGWLRKGGLFIAIVPNATSLHRRVGLHLGLMDDYYELGEQDLKVGHRRYYDLNSLRKEISKAGLCIVSSGGILLKPFPNAEMERLSQEYCDALYEIGKGYPELCAEVFVACKRFK